MTSNINSSLIDENFPVAGRDNNSQGFRDNFTYIKDGLATAKNEITILQSRAVLNQSLSSSEPVDNNLAGSSINNGYYNNFHGTSFIASSTSGTVSVDITAASVQVFTITSNTSFTFRNWPNGTYYAKLRLHLISGDSTAHTISFYSEGGGAIHLGNSVPAPFNVLSNGKHQVVDVWSYNNGASVFVHYLGSF